MDLYPAKTLQVLKLIDRLEDLDDVQTVYTNLNIWTKSGHSGITEY